MDDLSDAVVEDGEHPMSGATEPTSAGGKHGDGEARTFQFDRVSPAQIDFMDLYLKGFGVNMTRHSKSHVSITSPYQTQTTTILMHASHLIATSIEKSELEERNASMAAAPFDREDALGWMTDAYNHRTRGHLSRVHGVVNVRDMTLGAATMLYDATHTSPDEVLSELHRMGYADALLDDAASEAGGAAAAPSTPHLREMRVRCQNGFSKDMVQLCDQFHAEAQWSNEADDYFVTFRPPKMLQRVLAIRVQLAIQELGFIEFQRSLLKLYTAEYARATGFTSFPLSALRWELTTGPAPAEKEAIVPSLDDAVLDEMLQRDAGAAQRVHISEAMQNSATPLFLTLSTTDASQHSVFRTAEELDALQSANVHAFVQGPPTLCALRVVHTRGTKQWEAWIPEQADEETARDRICDTIHRQLGVKVQVKCEGSTWSWFFAAPETVANNTTLTISSGDTTTLAKLMKNVDGARSVRDEARLRHARHVQLQSLTASLQQLESSGEREKVQSEIHTLQQQRRPPQKMNIFRASVDGSALLAQPGRVTHQPYLARSTKQREQAMRIARELAALKDVKMHLSTAVTYPSTVPPVYHVQALDTTLATSIHSYMRRRYPGTCTFVCIAIDANVEQSIISPFPLCEEQRYFRL